MVIKIYISMIHCSSSEVSKEMNKEISGVNNKEDESM